MRDPFYAGTLYPKTEKALIDAIKASFEHEKGPGALPSKKERAEPIKGLVAPHTHISLAGPCMAWSYLALAESPETDLYIIAAYNFGEGKSGIGMRTYAMPMGEVRVDQRFAQELVAKKTIQIADNFHERDHAIEIQIPWIQYVKKRNIKILPLLLGEDIDLKTLAVDIKETLVDQGKTATLIISGEFTHYGPAYTFVPYDKPAQAHIIEFDGKALEFLKANDIKGFSNFCAEHTNTIDAALPLQLAYHLLKPKKAVLEQYYTTADITGEQRNIVAMASILFN